MLLITLLRLREAPQATVLSNCSMDTPFFWGTCSAHETDPLDTTFSSFRPQNQKAEKSHLSFSQHPAIQG